jgi:hypothetical protein
MFAKRKKTLWSSLVSVAFACAVLGFTAARTIRLKPGPTATSSQLPDTRGPLQNIRFTLYDAGIFPELAHAKPGNVVIKVEDRTHRSAGLVVQREAGGVIRQVGPALGPTRGNAQFSLGAGRYAVFDASQPDKRAELVIEP